MVQPASSQSYAYSFKCILVGDSNVGKTSIINRLVSEQFEEELAATIGMEFRSKILEVEPGLPIKL